MYIEQTTVVTYGTKLFGEGEEVLLRLVAWLVLPAKKVNSDAIRGSFTLILMISVLFFFISLSLIFAKFNIGTSLLVGHYT
jgi:hypothetical protein